MQEDHSKAINAVINSNVDDRTKQRMIADIQDSYRRSQGDIIGGRTEPTSSMYQARHMDNDHLLDGKPNKRKKRNASKRQGTTMQESIDKPLRLAQIIPSNKANKKTSRSKQQPKKGGINNNKQQPFEDELQ